MLLSPLIESEPVNHFDRCNSALNDVRILHLDIRYSTFDNIAAGYSTLLASASIAKVCEVSRSFLFRFSNVSMPNVVSSHHFCPGCCHLYRGTNTCADWTETMGCAQPLLYYVGVSLGKYDTSVLQAGRATFGQVCLSKGVPLLL